MCSDTLGMNAELDCNIVRKEISSSLFCGLSAS